MSVENVDALRHRDPTVHTSAAVDNGNSNENNLTNHQNNKNSNCDHNNSNNNTTDKDDPRVELPILREVQNSHHSDHLPNHQTDEHSTGAVSHRSSRSCRSSDDGYRSSNENSARPTPEGTPKFSPEASRSANSFIDAHPHHCNHKSSRKHSDEPLSGKNSADSAHLQIRQNSSTCIPIVRTSSTTTNAVSVLPAGASCDYNSLRTPLMGSSLNSDGGIDARTPFGTPGVDSSSSVGGHHLSVNLGDRFMKQADSQREERFYATIAPYQRVLVDTAVRNTDQVIKHWSGELQDERDGYEESNSFIPYSERTRGAINNSNSNHSNSKEDGKTNEEEQEDAELLSREAERRLRLFRIYEEQGNQQNVNTQTNAHFSHHVRHSSTAEDLDSYKSTSQAEIEKIRLAASLWWNFKWEGPMPMLGKCFCGELSAPCFPKEAEESSSCTSTPLACDNATQVFPEYSLSTKNFEVQYATPEEQQHGEKAVALALLCPFVPRFHGLFSTTMDQIRRLSNPNIEDSGNVSEGGLSHPHDADNDEGETPVQLIVLEDVCYGFSHPCVLDMKIGARQYGLNASERKRKNKELKSRLTTSYEYGIRMAGFRRWDDVSQSYLVKSKLQCRTLSLNEIKSEITQFCRNNRQLELLYVEQLQKLRAAFQRQTVYRFYTSSLLFVFDAAAPLQTARITMVDFAYTYERKELIEANDDDAQYDYDINYIKAIDTLLSLFS